MPVRTLRDIIRHGAEAYGSQTAFRYKVKKEIVDRTYLDVDRDSMAVSRMVESMGMEGKHIALIGTTTYQWIVSYFGIVGSGSVAVPIDAQLPADAVCELLERADVEMLVFDEIRRDVAEAVKEKCPSVRYIVSMQAEEAAEGVQSLAMLMALHAGEYEKELDGGQLDEPELSRSAAVRQICEGLELENPSIQDAPLSMIETLQDAACQQMQEQVSQQTAETAATQLPDAQEQSLDEYPMPDSEVSVSDMQEYGYLYDGMLPVTRERALELDAAGLTVYLLHEDNTESMVFDTEEIMEHGGLFGVEHEEWEQSPAFHEKVLERQERQMEREQAFLAHEGSCFAIYQVSRDDPQNVRFMNLDWLQSHNLAVDRNNYDMIYTAPLNGSGSAMEQLETLYEQFNLQKPVDFHSPSMSVSDIVAIKQDGKVSCHYCDSVGFTEIPGFLPDNPLKNAEMMLEDDYGMIDGIINNGPKERTVAQLEQQARSGQPISLMDLAAAAHREERDKKKSVMEQLKSQPRTERKKAAPKKSAEREI